MPAAAPRGAESPPLEPARAEFVAGLARRLDAQRAALRSLEEEPSSAARRDNLLRRLHAMGAAARVLGLEPVARALDSAEEALRRSAGAVAPGELAEVARALDRVPTLAWGGEGASHGADASGEGEAAVPGGWPPCLLVAGPEALAAPFTADAAAGTLEQQRVATAGEVLAAARWSAPDVVVLDGDLPDARQVAEAIVTDPELEPAALVVVVAFEQPERAAAFAAAGATRVLPKPVSPDTLRRTTLEVAARAAPAAGPVEALGSGTVERLAARLAAELERGIAAAVEPGARGVAVDLGEGTEALAAVWGAVARVRELVTLRSAGRVRFSGGGPAGALPVGAWGGPDRREGQRGESVRRAPAVALGGRRILVVDDDPAVVWFLASVLGAAGAEVLEAHDGSRALALAEERWPEVVVSDVLMPGLDGFALCQRLRADVALRDVPVLLLSWKEDLLQRMRDLGVDAQGQLRKEADSATVVARVREVLWPRARLEARLAAPGEARGRLDGVSPRLVLELVARRRKDARVTFRDALFLHEVELRSGFLRSVTRTASDGGFARGDTALRSLLGVEAGRFTVVPASGPCRRDFEGPLALALAPSIGKVRAVQRGLVATAPNDLVELELERELAEACASVAPPGVQEILRRLAEGASPRELVTSAPERTANVSAALADLARRGALVGGRLADGSSLAREAPALPPAPPARAAPPPAPFAPGAPAVATPAPPPRPASATPPPASAPAAVHVESPGIPPAEGAAQFSLALSASPPAAETSRPAGGTAEPAAAAAAPAAPATPARSAASTAPVPATPAAAPAASPTAAVAPATPAVSAATPAPAAPPRPAPPEPPAPAPDKGGIPMQPATDPAEVDLAFAVLAGGDSDSDAPPPAAPGPIAAPERAAPASVPSAPPSSQRPEARRAAPELDAEGAPSSPLGDALSRAADSVRPAPAHRDPAPASASSPRAHDEDDLGSLFAAPEARDASRSESPPPVAATVEAARPRATRASEPPGSDRPRVSRRSAPDAPEPSPAPAAARATGSRTRNLVIGLGAAVASFVGLRFALPGGAGPSAAGSAAVLGTESPVDPSTLAPPPTAAQAKPAAAAAKETTQVTELELPPGVTVPAGQGLLEVVGTPAHSLYVDGSFMGKGPMRRLPVAPGAHQVSLRTDGDELGATAEVVAGRRTQVSVTHAPR
ncbi:MAG: response regulator [Polyangiaceae bacterium]|nr:response regulator [Polyangiaceae bacterium]